jgi:hypothetical protein
MLAAAAEAQFATPAVTPVSAQPHHTNEPANKRHIPQYREDRPGTLVR